MVDPMEWVVLAAVVVVALFLDLFVFHRHGSEPSLRSAVGWSVAWISLGLGFGGWIWASLGEVAAKEYLAAFLLEKSLSVDNLFVISVIFSYFAIPRARQHRVLFWGILAAVLFRGIAIGLGVELLHRLEWMTYVFGGFLVYTAYKLVGPQDPDDFSEDTLPVRIARRFFPFTSRLEGDAFFVREGGKWVATPLFLTLIVVETTDVLFAVDSIPAVLGVSRTAYVVYASNVFAILGLRALYFVLADAVVRFHYMKHGLAVILGFVGVKMIAAPVYEISIEASLTLIAVVLTATGVASALRDRQAEQRREEFEAAHGGHTAEGAPERVAVPGGRWGPTERVTMLHRLPTFRSTSIEDLKELAQDLYVLEFDAGEDVFSQGQPADALFVILNGKVAVFQSGEGGETHLADLMPGESFGELALFDDMPRTATVRAVEQTTVLALARDAFHALGERRPAVLMEVIRVLSRRLRDVNALLALRDGVPSTAETARRSAS